MKNIKDNLLLIFCTTCFVYSCNYDIKNYNDKNDKNNTNNLDTWFWSDDKDQEDKAYADKDKNIIINNNLKKDEILCQIKNISDNDKWKLIIDGEDHDKNSNIYDNERPFQYIVNGKLYQTKDNGEPGYKDTMLDALEYVLSENCINEKFTPDLFLEIHKRACPNSFNEDFKKFRVNINSWFGLTNGNFSNQGKKEFDNKIYSLWKSDRLFWTDEKFVNKKVGNLGRSGIFKKWEYNAPDINNEADVIEAINIIFDDYYDKFEELNKNNFVQGSFLDKNADLTDKKLEIIIRTCQNLDLLHAFRDGNIRTIAFLVLQKMLIENDLTPTIFWNPNCLDFKSVKEIMVKLKRGQKRYLELLNHK